MTRVIDWEARRSMVITPENIDRPSLVSAERVAIALYVPARNRTVDQVARITGVVPARVHHLMTSVPTSRRDEIIGMGERAKQRGRELGAALAGAARAGAFSR